MLKLVGQPDGGQTHADRTHHEHQRQHAEDAAPTQRTEFSPGNVSSQQRKQHRDRQLRQFLNQAIQFSGVGAWTSTDNDARRHRSRQGGFRQQPLTDAIHQKQQTQTELKRQSLQLIGFEPSQQLRQQPADARANQHTTAQSIQQAEHHLTPAVQVAKDKLQQQQG